MRRALATLFTLGMLFSFLLAVIVGLMLYLEVFSLGIAVLLVVLINVVMLLVSPWISDRIYGWLYDAKWVTPEEFRDHSPASMAVIEEVTQEYGYSTPKLGIIPDRNPTAFTYGSARYNARIVLTEGCFEYLDDEEVASVVAHELGHVTSRDFIIMTLANTIVQLLYLIAVNSMRIARHASSYSTASRKNPLGALALVGIVAYILWYVSEYVVLYLSRVREYAADAFAAEHTDADDLSQALIKIALGLVLSDDDPELLKTTRNLGIMSLSQSKEKGMIYHTSMERGERDPLLQALLFDIVSPWAHLLELKSTHPLTGKRIRTLSEGVVGSRFDFTDIRARFSVDRRRLYREFARDLAVMTLPAILAIGIPVGYIVGATFGSLRFSPIPFAGGWLLGIGIALLIGAAYRYPRGEPEEVTVLDLLTDVYASPVDGRRVTLEGELIGRGTAGYRFSEDLMFKDGTGFMYLKYDSWLPLLGDFLFSVKEVPKLIGESVTVEGWFFRATSPWMGLRRLAVGDRTISGFIHLGSFLGAVLVIVLGLGLLGLSLFL